MSSVPSESTKPVENTTSMSEFFTRAKNTRIANGTFSHVQGDQYNTTTIVQAKENTGGTHRFFDVKRGAIYNLRDIGCYTYPRRWDEDQEWSWAEGHPRADKIILAAEIVDRPGRIFTVVEYRGPEATKAFEEDFTILTAQCGSGTQDICRVYGYNKLKIPSLILYNELMPVAQSGLNVGRLGAIYLRCLSYQLGCEGEELWLDYGRGVICRGPPGPEPMLAVGGIHGIGNLPLATELLQEDVLLRFLATLKSKKIWKICSTSVVWGTRKESAEPGPVSQPAVISALTNMPIGIANNIWESNKINLSDRRFLDNGLTRFTLIGGSNIWLWLNWDVWEAWLLQAWSIFRAHGLSLEDDLSQYKLVYSRASLDGYVSNSRSQRARRSRQPVYLFIHPPPPDPVKCETSPIHY
ncbi:hypothetical protein PQX77_015756, partial [Marasmius sp. AFHP31]